MSTGKDHITNRRRVVRVTLATLVAASLFAAPAAQAQGRLGNLFGGGGPGSGGMGGGAMNLAMLIGLFSMFGGQNQGQNLGTQPQTNLVKEQGERDKAAREKLLKLEGRVEALESKL